jgi:hypothetical protein
VPSAVRRCTTHPLNLKTAAKTKVSTAAAAAAAAVVAIVVVEVVVPAGEREV